VVETLWHPYHRGLAATVERFGLADDADHVAAQTEFLCDRLDTDSYHAWVAVDDDRVVPDLATDAKLVGFVAVGRDEAPDNFDRPDRLVVADLYVQPSRSTAPSNTHASVAVRSWHSTWTWKTNAPPRSTTGVASRPSGTDVSGASTTDRLRRL
jgi:hypothetical protein